LRAIRSLFTRIIKHDPAVYTCSEIIFKKRGIIYNIKGKKNYNSLIIRVAIMEENEKLSRLMEIGLVLYEAKRPSNSRLLRNEEIGK
jgi:hypothetical protein